MEVGTHVKVTDDELTIHMREGTVVSVEGTRISVQFGRECRYELYGPYTDDEPDYIEPLREDQLEVVEALSAKTIADREFPGGHHHSSIEYEYSEGVEHQCMLSTCDAPSTHYTYVNYIGLVMRFHTCETHHNEHNLKRSESIELAPKPVEETRTEAACT